MITLKMSISITNTMFTLVSKLINACDSYAKGMSHYIRLNNIKKDDVSIIKDKIIELKDVRNPITLFCEVNNVIHEIIKCIVVRYFPSYIHKNRLFWTIIFPLVLPTSIKLGNRYSQNKCICDHTKDDDVVVKYDHFCDINNGPSMNIYFLSSMNNRNNQNKIVNILTTFGNVVIGPHEEYLSHDKMELLEPCDLLIIDITDLPKDMELRVRKMELSIPILCIHNETIITSPMINNGQYLTTIEYDLNTDSFNQKFIEDIRSFIISRETRFRPTCFRPLKIYLVGPPGVGKSNVAVSVANMFYLAHINIDQLLEGISNDNTHQLQETILYYFSHSSKMIPGTIITQVLKERLSRPDCRIFGYVLDGYGSTQDQLDLLVSLEEVPTYIFKLECLDDKLLTNRLLEKSNYPTEKIPYIINTYRNNQSNLIDGRFVLPDSTIIRVDGSNNDESESYILDTLNHLENRCLSNNEANQPYAPIKSISRTKLTSDKFHFNVNVEGKSNVLQFAKNIYREYQRSQGNLEIYPITSLFVGPQQRTESIYSKIVNFKSIDSDQPLNNREAFMIGKLGNNFDLLLLDAALGTAKYFYKDCTIDLGENIGKWILTKNGDHNIIQEIEENRRYFHLFMDFLNKYSSYSILPKKSSEENKLFRFHLQFDVPIDEKQIQTLSLSLSKLTEECSKEGIYIGGWTVTRRNQFFRYHSTQFYESKEINAVTMLASEAVDLADILAVMNYDVDVEYTLEVIHDIWTFDS
jgi:adenylate kinase family enzyme